MFWRRRLPQWVPEMAILVVTWKLAGAEPEPQAELITNQNPRRCQTGPRWLADPRIADMVVEALHYGETSGRYDRLAWAVMPNHVHMVILPRQPPNKIMNWLKSATGNRANAILGRTGQPFWMREYYDRWMRSEQEISKTIVYAENNPARAGLSSAADEYPWSSAAGKTGGGTRANLH